MIPIHDFRATPEPDTSLSKASFTGHKRTGYLAGVVLGAGLASLTFSGCDRPAASHAGGSPTPITSPQATRQNGIPSSLTMDERVLSIGTNLEVLEHGDKFGEIQQTIMSWGKQFKLFDKNGALIATAKQQAISWGVKIDIYDAQGLHIGTVKEKIFESMFSIKSQYAIVTPGGEEIASSEKLDFFGSDVTVKDRAGEVVVRMTRPMLNIGGDKWKVSFSGELDRRLLIFIPAYKTAADNDRD